MSRREVRLLLVDDHRVVRLGLKTLFATERHFRVVGEAGSVGEAVLEARRCRPDVIVMDVRLPDGSGVEACEQIRSETPSAKVLMLTSFADEDALFGSIMAGAGGYLLKQTDPERLVEAVEALARGDSLLDPAVTQVVLERLRVGGQRADNPLAALTEQEHRILLLIADGKTNRQIATTLFLSEHTVKTYISNLFHKLNLTRRAEAAAFIARHESNHRASSCWADGRSDNASS